MKKAVKHVAKADKILARHIKRLGPPRTTLTRNLDPFQGLLTSIVFQQLAGKAAQAILSRVLALYSPKPFPSPQDVLDTPDELLRKAGLSGSKTKSIKDLALKTIEGIVPTSAEIKKLKDAEIVERLVQIRGIGRWTAEMLLIKLGRHDVLPSTDYGIRKGFQLVYKKRSLPAPKAIEKHGEIWRPYRTVASIYLWLILDTANDG